MNRLRLGGALVLLAFVGGCSSSAKPAPGMGCALNSDCASGLVCTFGLCHAACVVNGDCPTGELCVKTAASASSDGSSTINVCQLPVESSCVYNSNCKSPLVCARDEQCRNQCQTDVDCVSPQICTASKVCALTSQLVPGTGDVPIVTTGKTDGGVGGGAGAAGQSGAAGASGGATAGTGGKATAGMGGGATGGAGGGATAGTAGGATAGTGGGGTAGAGAGTGGAPSPVNGDPCVVGDGGGFAPETTSNDDPAHATPVALGTPYAACIQSTADVDYYLFSIPSTSVQGGWLTVLVNDVATGLSAQDIVLSAADNSNIIQVYSPNAGANVASYVAGKSGASFLVRVGFNLGQPGSYTITGSYLDVPESGEPNNIRSQATPLTVGTPFAGKFFAGYLTSTAPSATDWTDWFSVPLEVGSYTVKMTGVPADINPAMSFYDTLGNKLQDTSSGTGGADLSYTAVIATAGTYFVSTIPNGFPTPSGSGSILPMWGTGTYTLTVSPAQ